MEGDVRSDSSGGRDAGVHLGLAPVSWIRLLGPFPGEYLWSSPQQENHSVAPVPSAAKTSIRTWCEHQSERVSRETR